MDVKLIVVGGKANKGSVYVRLPTVVGRSREADLTVSHPMVSRRHCEMFQVDGQLRIRDLGSLNGTVVGGHRITEAPLRPHEEFSVGPLTFRVEYEYAGDSQASADSEPANENQWIPPALTGSSPEVQAADFHAVDFPTAGERPTFVPCDIPDGFATTGDPIGVTLPDAAEWQRLAEGSPPDPDERGLSEQLTPPGINAATQASDNAVAGSQRPEAATPDSSGEEPSPPPIRGDRSPWSSGPTEEPSCGKRGAEDDSAELDDHGATRSDNTSPPPLIRSDDRAAAPLDDDDISDFLSGLP